MRRILTKIIIHLVLARKILHNQFPIPLGVTVVPRKIEYDLYAKFWGETRCIRKCENGEFSFMKIFNINITLMLLFGMILSYHYRVLGQIERRDFYALQPWPLDAATIGRWSCCTPGGGGRGGTPLYKPYRYVPSQRVGFLGLFGLKTGIHFAHFGLELGMVFEGTTGAYERSYRFNSK